ncbi:MAG: DUF4476 domain-containing protein [Candidatus Cloacimonetes bacterium]|nr:DUF4476 domain-containing protein [Candidatus Cloacimonadota bacterium]
MKNFFLITLLTFSVLVFCEEVSIKSNMRNMSVNVESQTGKINIADEIAKRLDILQEKYISKLNKLDQKRTEKIIEDIYELLVLFPEDITTEQINQTSDINITFEIKDQTTEPTTNTNLGVKETISPQAQSDSEFQALIANVKNEGFADDKTSVVRITAKSRYFNISQLISLLDVFSFSDDKINIVTIVYPRIVDKVNAHNLLGAFTYSADKAKIEQIISQ